MTQPSPPDPNLPHLATLLDPDAMQPVLRHALADPAARLDRVDLVRHKPGRRAIVRYRLDGTTLYAKTFASERGPKVFDVASTIVDAAAFGPDVALPVPVAYLPDLKTILQREVPGEPVAPALLRNDTTVATRIASAMHCLHTSGIDLGRHHGWEKELSPLPDRVAQVRDHDAGLGALAASCLDRIEATDPTRFTWRALPIHRDLYHDQVLIDGDRLAVIDLDDAAMSEPAVDVANVVAHLMLLGAQHGSGTGALQPAIDSILDQSFALDPDLDASLVSLLVGATLVRLAGIHIGRARGLAVANDLLHTANRLLHGGCSTLP